MFTISMEAQDRLSESALRDQQELDKLLAKERIVNASKLEFEQRKIYLHEYRQAVRAASYTTVCIRQDGTVGTETKNELQNLPQRLITNFRIETIVELISSEGDRGFFGLRICVDQTSVQLFLDAEKLGKSEYLMKKLTAVGGKILVDKDRERRNILVGLWAELFRRCEERLSVPTEFGWNKIENEYRFVKEGATLWSDVIKWAK